MPRRLEAVISAKDVDMNEWLCHGAHNCLGRVACLIPVSTELTLSDIDDISGVPLQMVTLPFPLNSILRHTLATGGTCI
ncbi:hypothetical protein TNCV_3963671 [Trichonephila clavipes]|nr:hypothetical protein TNCV_3963671 [Trichonephila clavipes]